VETERKSVDMTDWLEREKKVNRIANKEVKMNWFKVAKLTNRITA